MTLGSGQGGHVHANGIRQHYIRYGGRGTPLILVPGITSPAITWGFVAKALAQTLDIYVLDVRGRGLSLAGPELDYRLDACADDIAAFSDAMGLVAPMALGHSMGARHLIRSVARGGCYARLALIDPPVSGPGRRPYPAALPWYVDSMALARYGADVAALRAFTPSWTDEQIALRAEWLHTCDERAILASFAGFHEDDIHGDLSALDMPVLLVGAERGDVVLDADVAEIRSLNPAIDFARVPGAGHMIPWDNLSGFLSAVLPFLNSQSLDG
jgi:N-formylmaleamate deformylase